MSRWHTAARLARTVSFASVAAGVVALWATHRHPAAWSWVVGSLLGVLNFQMLASGIQRALGLGAGAAQGAFLASSLLRLGLMGVLLYWLASRGPQLWAGYLLAGVFLPQAVFLVRYYRTREEDSMR
jgi:hypothetical protein